MPEVYIGGHLVTVSEEQAQQLANPEIRKQVDQAVSQTYPASQPLTEQDVKDILTLPSPGRYVPPATTEKPLFSAQRKETGVEIQYIGGVPITMPTTSEAAKSRAETLAERIRAERLIRERETSRKETDEFYKLNAELPDGKFIEKSKLNEIKEEAPEVYQVLVTKGFDEAQKIVEQKRTEYSNYQLATERLKNYSDNEGSVYGYKYLQDNPGDTTTLKQAGFSDKQIEQWQEYNKNTWVRRSSQEKFMEAFIKAGGDPVNGNTPEEMDDILKKNPSLMKMQYQDEDLKTKTKADISLAQFTANYIAERKNNPIWQHEGSEAVLKDMAREEYNRVYGKGTMVASQATNIASIFFAPARALHPEVEIEDISGLEWAIGASQIALLAAPMIAAPFGTAGTVVRTTINAAGASTFATVTGLQWQDMSDAERALSLGLDLIIIGSVLRGAGVRVDTASMKNITEGIKSNIKSAVSKEKFESAINTLTKGMESNKAAMIRRGAHELEVVAGELELSPREIKMIKDGGSYISKNSSKYSDIINKTREYNASETAKMKSDVLRSEYNNQSAKMMKTNAKVWEKLDNIAVQKHINDKLQRLYDYLKGTKARQVPDTAISEAKFKINIKNLQEKYRKNIETYKNAIQRTIDDILDDYQRSTKSKKSTDKEISEAKFKVNLKELKEKYHKSLSENNDSIQRAIDDILDDYQRSVKRPTEKEISKAKFDVKLSELKDKYKKSLEQNRDIIQREIDDILDNYQRLKDIKKPSEKEISAAKFKVRLDELKTKYEKMLSQNNESIQRAIDDILDDYQRSVKRPTQAEVSEAKFKMKLKELKEKYRGELSTKEKEDVKKLFDDIEDYLKSGKVGDDDIKELMDDVDDILKGRDIEPAKGGGVATKEKVKTEVKPKQEVKPKKETKTEVKTETKKKTRTFTRTYPYTDTELAVLTKAAMDYVIKPGQLISESTLIKYKNFPVITPDEVEIPEEATEKGKTIIKPKTVVVVKLKPSDEPVPKPTPKPDEEPKEEEKPHAVIPEVPEPTPPPEPTPKPTPEPETPPKPPGEKTGLIYRPRSRQYQEKARKIVKESGGAMAWRMGEVGKLDRWDVVVNPYTSNEQYYMILGKQPEGATILQRGKGSAYGTAQVIRGEGPKREVKVDSGFVDITITPTSKNSVKMRVTPDPKMETKGDITIGNSKPRISRRMGRISPKMPKLK